MLGLALALCLAGSPGGGAAADEQEEADLRAELQRIIAEDPAHAAEAQKVLDALNQPPTSREGRQARNRRQRGERRIVNGLPSRSHPAVGALLRGGDPQNAAIQCTGTLVGCDKFLTAAHCIVHDPAPDNYLVFFQELGFVRVKAIDWAQNAYQYPHPYFDLAMLTLAEPVEGIAPMPVNDQVEPLAGSIATIVGFGRTGGARFDYGIKREGSVKTAACPAALSFLADAKVLCWDFDADVTASDSASNTCNADSGGGIFMRDQDGRRVVEKLFGVVSGGTNSSCLTKDVSYNVDVFHFRDWIASAGEGRLSSAMCGRPLWGDGAGGPVRRLFRLDDDRPEARFSVAVPEGIAALRIAMNAEDDGTGRNGFQFAVYNGEPGARRMPVRAPGRAGSRSAASRPPRPAYGPSSLPAARGQARCRSPSCWRLGRIGRGRCGIDLDRASSGGDEDQGTAPGERMCRLRPQTGPRSSLQPRPQLLNLASDGALARGVPPSAASNHGTISRASSTQIDALHCRKAPRHG